MFLLLESSSASCFSIRINLKYTLLNDIDLLMLDEAEATFQTIVQGQQVNVYMFHWWENHFILDLSCYLYKYCISCKSVGEYPGSSVFQYCWVFVRWCYFLLQYMLQSYMLLLLLSWDHDVVLVPGNTIIVIWMG